MKIGSVEYVLSVHNSFDKNIKFTYEEQHNNILDVLFIRDGEKRKTSVNRKDTHSELYLHLELIYTNQLKKRDIEVVNVTSQR